MDKLSFLEGENPAAEEPEAEAPEQLPEAEATVAEEVQAEPEQPARDERGRFASKEEKPDPVMVPLAALHEARDKAKAAEERLARIEQQRPAEPVAVPDVLENPEGFTQHFSQAVNQAIYQERLANSQRFAVISHGKEAVDQALEWGVKRCAEDPSFNAQVMSNPDPVGFAVEQFRRDQIASTVTNDEFAQFQAWKAAQAQVTPQPNPIIESPPPPASILTAPSAGKEGMQHVPTGPGQAYDSLFSTG